MTTIFLNLGPRKTGEELLPDAPFRAFVKFNTPYGPDGGSAVLTLEQGDARVGTATIDWRKVESLRHPSKRGRYHVGSGHLDEFDIQNNQAFSDWQIANLITEAMKKAGWTYLCYDYGIGNDDSQKLFEAWVENNL